MLIKNSDYKDISEIFAKHTTIFDKCVFVHGVMYVMFKSMQCYTWHFTQFIW